MSTNFFLGISLTGSFLAGVLALFAPCCITFLLPSYLGTIFKKSEQVMLYTVIFALGLASVLVPIALGFKFIVSFFDVYHASFYYVGAALLIGIGIMTYGEVKLPVYFSFVQKQKQKTDAASVYALGVMSGLTSSCCAPVLFAAVTLTSLAPSTFQAIIVAGAYIFGIVFPLFLLSFVYQHISTTTVLRIQKKGYVFFKLLGSVIFILSGIWIAIMNFQGKIVMLGESDKSSSLRMVIYNISSIFHNSFIDIFVFATLLLLFIRLIRQKKYPIGKDPICGMSVYKDTYTVVREGKMHVFCSQHCLDIYTN